MMSSKKLMVMWLDFVRFYTQVIRNWKLKKKNCIIDVKVQFKTTELFVQLSNTNYYVFSKLRQISDRSNFFSKRRTDLYILVIWFCLVAETYEYLTYFRITTNYEKRIIPNFSKNFSRISGNFDRSVTDRTFSRNEEQIYKSYWFDFVS